jgi:hypothetical protein
MKKFTTITLAAILAGGALSVQAAGQDNRELNLCKAELLAYYGEETELMLVDKRRNPYGTRMRMAVRLDADNAYFATCWVPREGEDRFAVGHDNAGLNSTDSALVSR